MLPLIQMTNAVIAVRGALRLQVRYDATEAADRLVTNFRLSPAIKEAASNVAWAQTPEDAYAGLEVLITHLCDPAQNPDAAAWNITRNETTGKVESVAL